MILFSGMLLAMVHDEKCDGDSKFMKVGDFVTEIDPEIPVRSILYLINIGKLNNLKDCIFF